MYLNIIYLNIHYFHVYYHSNITFWTAHQVSNHTVVKAQRYYDNFPLDNIKEDSSLLLCVFLVYESVNKIIGWEADECNDSSARHGLVCDIVFPEGSYVSCDYFYDISCLMMRGKHISCF